MRPHSKVLAHRIDVMIAFQNGENVQYRRKRSELPWNNSPSKNLSFDFDIHDYRIKPVLIEGYVDPKHLHTKLQGGCHVVGCIKVRQVE